MDYIMPSIGVRRGCRRKCECCFDFWRSNTTASRRGSNGFSATARSCAAVRPVARRQRFKGICEEGFGRKGTMTTLYHHGSSVCAAKVRLVLAEKSVPWDGIYVDILRGDQFDPAYMKLNPKA